SLRIVDTYSTARLDAPYVMSRNTNRHRLDFNTGIKLSFGYGFLYGVNRLMRVHYDASVQPVRGSHSNTKNVKLVIISSPRYYHANLCSTDIQAYNDIACVFGFRFLLFGTHFPPL